MYQSRAWWAHIQFQQSIATAVHLASVKRKLNFRKQYLSIQFRDREDDDNNPAKE
jgi:hypothetical protein